VDLQLPVFIFLHKECETNLSFPHLDWIVQCFTSRPTQYRLYGSRFLQVKRPNQQYQVLKEMLQKRKQRTKTT